MRRNQSEDKLAIMQEGGRLLANIRDRLLGQVRVEETPLAIDQSAQRLIDEVGGTPSFMTVSGYRWATCISVNDGVVHGVPTDKKFEPGDVVGVDVGLLYKGYHTDTSWTKIVPGGNNIETEGKQSFLNIGEMALEKAISQSRAGNRIGHISSAIQTTIEGAGYHVVKNLVGHGIGKRLHEPPSIPGILSHRISDTPLLKTGMTLAVEVIYAQGNGSVVHANDDGWTLVTEDGSLSGLFEHTIAITEKEPIVLTQSS